MCVTLAPAEWPLLGLIVTPTYAQALQEHSLPCPCMHIGLHTTKSFLPAIQPYQWEEMALQGPKYGLSVHA